ncbi:TMV resistance protein N-like [Arachis stenosperma]|uniref:TMV resistance protein N-like n=1 Tax=Arachis stenosperma TaxID=217475 RepID=UPI0025AB80F2|nr:TMV resistance protein N-like [Arachis stenosperma]
MAANDVFLSFRGGTRYRFSDHLYGALRQNRIETFRDNENLRVGDELEPILMKAIENCEMAVVVLCENYASSTWCLRELVKIIDCHEKQGKQVLPIIYRVNPSDVWDQKGSYETAMAKHESREDPQKVKAWRLALSKVEKLGWVHCTDDMSEPEFIKVIVRDTLGRLPLPEPTDHVVGLDTPCEEVKSRLDIESNENVYMLGIYGPGGIGKTTLAKCLFDKIKRQFEASCFLANVREKSESRESLESLQKTLLDDMGEETITEFGSEFKGGSEIKRRLRHKRVLLVLDDVNSITQLESLAGGHDWFGSGSRIILTTRDTDMVDKHVMGDVVTKKYKMEELNDDDSLELFSWHAFNSKEPAENFENVSRNAISYAKGFPLALEVIGSHLGGFESVVSWEEELDQYRIDPSIQGVLKRSYDSLYELDQKTFLDIACFFKGEKWEYVKRVLKACDFYPVVRVFISKCLITVNQNGCLEMHDLVQDMGKEIVTSDSPTNPGKRSRLWSHKDILQVLKDDTGSTSIEGIMLHPATHEEVDHWITTAFNKMENLRILIVRNTIFSTAPSCLPKSLRLLEWKGYPSESSPLDFNPNRIVDLKLPHSALKLEKSFQIFEDLTFINLSQCQSITQIPNVSGAKSLRVFTLDRCHKLVKFDESVGFLPNLVYLSASECRVLRSFVPRMYLPSLEVLSFYFCKKLQNFPDVLQKMDKPLKIYLANTAIKEFPDSIGNLIGLEHIDISICRGLKDLPSSFFTLPKLFTLTIEGCYHLRRSFKRFKESHSTLDDCPNIKRLNFTGANLSDEDLHPTIQVLQKLEDVNVSHNDFVSLPNCIERSLNIKCLDVSYCKNLKSIPELPSSIQKVDARYCLSLTSESSTELWSKVLLETERIQIVMPKKEIPNLFDCDSSEGIPLFWARGKFPVVALAFMFGRSTVSNSVAETRTDILGFFPQIGSSMSAIVRLHLFIGGKQIFPKDSKYFSVGEDHVLLFDLRALFSDEEWHGLDAYLGVGDDGWKAIQVQCESSLTLSHWGVYVYKQDTNSADIQFKNPNPKSPLSDLVPKRSPHQPQESMMRQVAENLNPRELLGDYLPLVELTEVPSFTSALLRSLRTGKAEATRPESSAYGASLKQEHEESNWNVSRVMDMIKDDVPTHIADAYSNEIREGRRFVEELMRARMELLKEKGQERMDIDMAIVLEQPRSGKPPCRRYWGRLHIKHEELTAKAILRKTTQLAWGFWNPGSTTIKEKATAVVLKCTGQGESSEEENNDPVLEELLSQIEEDAMRFNRSYGKMKACIILTDDADDLISEEYTAEFMLMRGKENAEMRGMSQWGGFELLLYEMMRASGTNMFGSVESEPRFEKTSYGKIRVEN